jgi:magnesium transporter
MEAEHPSPQTMSVGRAPGSLMAPPDATPTRITVIRYSAERIERVDDVKVDGLAALIDGDHRVVWIDVTGCSTIPVFEALVRDHGLPWLSMEDVLNAPQRPKVEPYGDARFVLVRQIQVPGTVEMDQICVYLTDRVVFTFQHREGDCFEGIRRRLDQSDSQLRRRGADYLCYRVVDACVDTYFPELERLGDAIEALEEEVLRRPTRSALTRLHELKRELRVLEKVILPLRDAVGTLTRDEAAFASDTRPYLRDVHDHTNQLLEQVHLLSQLATDCGDLALGSLDVRLNQAMRVLAAVTFVFMPLTFITSVYGMNFDNMPETKWEYGYFGVIALVVALGLGLHLWLKSRGWTAEE